MQSHVSSVSLLGPISTVSLDVIITSKTLLPLQETGILNVAGIRRAYSEKPKVGIFLNTQISYTKYLVVFDIAGKKRHTPCIPSEVSLILVEVR